MRLKIRLVDKEKKSVYVSRTPGNNNTIAFTPYAENGKIYYNLITARASAKRLRNKQGDDIKIQIMNGSAIREEY
ncbi:MAG: hypothetical protein F4X82_03425 [Candidatus Spechtbacteria bacterium SB0662_bin_43]|uniref:Uncharacterized protein n=1 Tax=Candidatus Spechtbacteria bacterium SB0662_bin_43 TaxID=2604897 RepID=A0A845DBW3_9BACT|nr:hypothetical protein [Candidatus Spechtbacteria bacterium SB0662_bin_43]